MAPLITRYTFRLSRLHSHVHNVPSQIHKLSNTLLHKIRLVRHNPIAREFGVPIPLFHADDMGPGPGPQPASLSPNINRPRHHFDPIPLNLLSIWGYLALAFVILAVVTVFLFMIYSCYHTAPLRDRSKLGMGVGVGEDARAGGVKGGWQVLEDPIGDSSGGGEMAVEGGEVRSAKDREVGEKVDVYQDESKQNDMMGPWPRRGGSGLKGLGIQLHRSSKSLYDFPNESQDPFIHVSPHSTCSERSLRSTSDREHEQDLESFEGSHCASMSALPLAHATKRSATYLLSNIPVPLPIPLPSPVTPSPAHKKQVNQKRTRLRALTQILSHNPKKGREMYFELQPMMTVENGTDQSTGLLSETIDESSPRSPSPLSSRSKSSPAQFAFFAPYSNCNLNSTATFTSNSWGNNSSSSSSTFPTAPITPLTPITPMTPVTPVKSGPATTTVAAIELQFDAKVAPTTLATPDQVHNGHRDAKLRLGYLRRGVSLSSPPSPSPSSSSSSYSSSNSATSSPSIATARFMLDRDELKRNNLRNRDRVGLNKEKEREKENYMKPLSPIPRPVFLPPQL